jgi:hypothetical protein
MRLWTRLSLVCRLGARFLDGCFEVLVPEGMGIRSAGDGRSARFLALFFTR